MLGAHGIEHTLIEVYHFGPAAWIRTAWATPHLIPHCGYALLIRDVGVLRMGGFETVLPWVTPSKYIAVPLTHPDTSSRKGKEREYTQ